MLSSASRDPHVRLTRSARSRPILSIVPATTEDRHVQAHHRHALPHRRTAARRSARRATLLALAWVALGQVSRLFVFAPLHSSAIWLASGLALAVLARTPRRDWPVYALALFLAEALPGFFFAIPWEVSLLWGVGDTLSVLAGAWLLRSWLEPNLIRFG